MKSITPEAQTQFIAKKLKLDDAMLIDKAGIQDQLLTETYDTVRKYDEKAGLHKVLKYTFGLAALGTLGVTFGLGVLIAVPFMGAGYYCHLKQKEAEGELVKGKKWLLDRIEKAAPAPCPPATPL